MERLSLAIDLFLTVPDVDYQEQVHDELLQEVYVAELQDEASCLAEHSVHGNLLQSSVVSDIVSELVDVLNHSHVVVNEHTPTALYRASEVYDALVKIVFLRDIDVFLRSFFHIEHLVILCGALSIGVLTNYAVFFLMRIDQFLIRVIRRALNLFENKIDLGELLAELVFHFTIALDAMLLFTPHSIALVLHHFLHLNWNGTRFTKNSGKGATQLGLSFCSLVLEKGFLHNRDRMLIFVSFNVTRIE